MGLLPRMTTLLCWLFLLLHSISADIQVYYINGMGQAVAEYMDQPADFGEMIPPKGLSAFIVYSNPEDACSPIDPPPRNVSNFTKRWAVLIKRRNCSYEDKVMAAQNATFDIAIVHNNESDALYKMHAPFHPEKLYIPAVFVSLSTGLDIREKYTYDKGFLMRISEDGFYDLTKMLIPFLVVISLCFITMLAFLVVKCIKDHRRARRRRMPNSSLRKIPICKYRKGDPYETCAICLDDYIEGEKLRILPCSHAYHCKCIDHWLTRTRRVCPMCKRKVFAQDEVPPTDTDSGSESDDHTTPLLRTAQATQGGTFTRVLAVSVLNSQPSDYEDAASSRSGASSDSSRVQQPTVTAHPHVPPPSHTSLVGTLFTVIGGRPSFGRSPSRNALLGSREEVSSTEDNVI